MAPGFKKVKIEPDLGKLSGVSAKVPQPEGSIQLKLKKDDNGMEGEIWLPNGIQGEFIWMGKSIELYPGKQKIKM